MQLLDSTDSAVRLLKQNKMVLIYFESINCNVCNVLKPKVENILVNYPNITSAYLDVDKSLEAAAEFNIFTIPAILLFIEGKEVIREARNVSLAELDAKINRYYDLLFN